MRRLIPRFRVFTLLLLTTLAAVCISHYRTWQELEEVRAQLASLRNDVLVLDISDTNQIHAIALPTYGDMQWRWRIQLPEKGRYRLRYSFGLIPESGLPDSSRKDDHIFLDPEANPIKGGESFIFSLSVFQDSEGKWKLSTGVPGRENIRPIDPAPAWLGESRKGWSRKVIGKTETIAVDADEELPLLRYRKGKAVGGGGWTVDMAPTEGMMFWIERIQEP